MSSRKPTVDDLDDIDDEDGMVEDESTETNDLTLIVETAEEVAMGADSQAEGPIDPDELDDDGNPEEEV
jgi:hypothetical protein